MAAGTGNLILKRGSVMPYNGSQDDVSNDTGAKVLLKGMPAAQIVGLSPYYSTGGSSEPLATAGAKYIGTSTTDYPNRLWMGTDAYATSDTEASDDTGTVRPYTLTGASVFNSTGFTRPLWIGAEIRASEPITEDSTGITFTGKITTASSGPNLTIDSGSIVGGALAAGMRIEMVDSTTGFVVPVLAEGSHLYSGSALSWIVIPRPPVAVVGTGSTSVKFKAYKDPYVVLKANWDKPSDYVLVTQKAISTMPLRVWEEKGDPIGGLSGVGVKEYVDLNAWDGSSETLPTNNKISSNTILYFPDYTNYVASDGVVQDTILVANIATASGSTDDPKKIYLSWSTTAAALQKYAAVTSGSNFALLGSDGSVKGIQTFLSPVGIENYVEILPYNVGATQYPATITSSVAGAASLFDTNITDLSMGGAAEFIEIGDGSTGGNTATTIYGELTITGPTNLSTDTVIDGGTF